MTWRDRIKNNGVDTQLGKGSYRTKSGDEAVFWIETDSLQFGRRTETHEYPLRDKPYVEDLGRRARAFTIDVVVIGPDYDLYRDALIAAIEQPGPGTLVHPYHGPMVITITECTKRESTREGGKCTFTLTCVEAGVFEFPSAITDTAAKVKDKANTALEAAKKAFSKRFDFTGLPGWQLTELMTEIDRTLANVNTYVGDIAAVIRTPYDLAATITNGLQTLRDTVTEPLRALNLYKELFNAGNDAPTIPQTTSNRQAQAANTAAVHALIQQTAVIEAARASSQAANGEQQTAASADSTSGSANYSSYASSTGALAVLDVLITAIDEQMESTDTSGNPIDDELYYALADLRVAVSEDLRIRGARLAELTTYTTFATLPALVIAHQVFGDASRDEEIIRRNHVAHPLFVSGGQALEVLSE